ncbi:alpha-hydroxy-acid oxidizing protein [Bradyrhizobium sp. DASA03007]|uniref:alpha-hydroxy-acid oxidizing protein n=1 Tax=unclassified Bradyrhizobium TaxID=2631580 RepID=UPI003F71471C
MAGDIHFPSGYLPSWVFWSNADEILAEVAREADIPFMLSRMAGSSVERVARVAPDYTCFNSTSRKTQHGVNRARDAGVRVLVLTVDFPVPNRNESAQRTGVWYSGGPKDWRQRPSVI